MFYVLCFYVLFYVFMFKVLCFTLFVVVSFTFYVFMFYALLYVLCFMCLCFHKGSRKVPAVWCASGRVQVCLWQGTGVPLVGYRCAKPIGAKPF